MNDKQNQSHIQANISKINDFIYLGTNACCQIHFQQELLDQGVTADISLEKENLDKPWGVDYFLWLPTADHAAPNDSQLKVGVDIIKRLVKDDKKVFVHCRNGNGRGPTLVIAYFMAEGMSFEDAEALVKKGRPEIHLETEQIKALKKIQW